MPKIITLFMVVFMISSCEENDNNSYGETSEAARMEPLNLEAQIEEIETLRIGDARAEVLELFTPMGGFSVNPEIQIFWYKKNPLIKIEIKFDFIDKDKEKWNPEDRIIEISKPYLQRGITSD